MTVRLPFIAGKHQDVMIAHALENARGACWAGMGMGKTSSALTALDTLNLVEPGPALVLAPLRVASAVWPAEAAKWAHLQNINVVPIIGTAEARRKALAMTKRSWANVFTMNYDNLPWLVEELNGEWPFSKVVSDESTRLKSFRLKQGGRRAQALGRVAHTKVKHWINLTGTPAPNGLKDLWGQTWFLDAGVRLGRTFTAFSQRWFRVGFNGYEVEPLPFANEQIHDKLRDICVTLDPKDYFDISDPIVRPVYVELPRKARAKYQQMEKEMFTQLEGHEVEAFTAAARTMKCLQLANGAAYIGEGSEKWAVIHDEKLKALESIVEEAAGAPVLVAYHFKSDLARILAAFPKARELDKDPATITAWNAGKIPMLIAHPASAGHGLNLQDGGHILAVFGHWWDLEQYQQIIERIGPVRQMQSGHPRPVFVYPIVARDTVDELVMLRRESKREVQDLLLEAMKRRS